LAVHLAEQISLLRIFPTEAATRRSSRRLSRIAKGRLTRCSKHAHARIAEGGGFLGEMSLLCGIDQIS
jgi:hypothetical protein